MIIAGVTALALVGAFVAGRFSAPLKVQTIDTVRVAFQDRIIEKVVTVQGKTETKIVFRDRVITKDGTITEHEVEKTATKEESTKTDDKTEKSKGSSEHTAETTTTLRPDWRVALQVGATWKDPWVKIAGPLVLGAQVDRRLIGGLSAGVWFNTYGAAGGALSFEF